jgi:hypothetical protein
MERKIFRMFGGVGCKTYGILLKRSETKKWRKKLACSKWLSMNETLACKTMFSCSNVKEIKRILHAN